MKEQCVGRKEKVEKEKEKEEKSEKEKEGSALEQHVEWNWTGQWQGGEGRRMI